jgi:hypothetical protein
MTTVFFSLLDFFSVACPLFCFWINHIWLQKAQRGNSCYYDPEDKKNASKFMGGKRLKKTIAIPRRWNYTIKIDVRNILSRTYGWLYTGYGLVNRFVDHLQVVTTNNYNISADFHAFQITTRKVFSRLRCLHYSFLGNNSQLWRLFRFCAYKRTVNLITAPSLLSLLCWNQLSTEWVVPIVFLITPLYGRSRKHRFHQWLYCCVRIRCRGNMLTDPLPRNSRCL